MKISLYFSTSELRAMNTVKEVFGITGINYDNVPMENTKFVNMVSDKTFSGDINDNITSGILYTIAKYDREIKAIVKAVKAYAESFAYLMTSGMFEELDSVIERNRKAHIDLKKNHKH